MKCLSEKALRKFFESLLMENTRSVEPQCIVDTWCGPKVPEI
jgi:hypothetical protein